MNTQKSKSTEEEENEKGFELGFTEKTKKNLWEWYESWKREDGDREESNYVVFFLKEKIIIPFPTMKMSSWRRKGLIRSSSYTWQPPKESKQGPAWCRAVIEYYITQIEPNRTESLFTNHSCFRGSGFDEPTARSSVFSGWVWSIVLKQTWRYALNGRTCWGLLYKPAAAFRNFHINGEVSYFDTKVQSVILFENKNICLLFDCFQIILRYLLLML